MAARLRLFSTYAFRAATLAAVAATSVMTSGFAGASSRRRDDEEPESSQKTPIARELLKNTRLLVRDAIEGDCSLWTVLLEQELASKSNQLLKDGGARLKQRLANMSVFAGRSNPQLAEEIAYELGMPLGGISLSNFADGEVSVAVLDNVRGKDVYVIQSTCTPVNENLLELLLIVSAMRRASAASITAIMPYYGYKRDVGTSFSSPSLRLASAREEGSGGGEEGPVPLFRTAPRSRPAGTYSAIVDRLLQDGKGGTGLPPSLQPPPTPPSSRTADIPVSASDVALMLETAGVDRIISVEMQPPGQGQLEGFFETRVPVESLRSTSIGVEHLARMGLRAPVIVAPNEACIQLAHDLRAGLASKTGKQVGFACIIEAGPSRGADRYVHAPRSRRNAELVGDVAGRDVVVVDDMLDTARTLMTRVTLLRDAGAGRIVAFATHGLFNDGALARINKSILSDVVVTNTVPLRTDLLSVDLTHKVALLSVAPLLAEAALRTQVGMSLLHLRKGADAEGPRYKGQE